MPTEIGNIVYQNSDGVWITKSLELFLGDLGIDLSGLDDKVDKTTEINGHALSANVDLDKTDIGLTDVDNVADADKQVSGPQQTALDLKVNKTTTVNGHALSGNIDVTKSDLTLGNVDNTSDANKPVSTAQAAAIAQAVTDLKDGVASPGDTLQKLYNLILGQSREVTAATIAARNALNITNLPTNVFVTDDGDGNWALYKATTTGVGATFVKISDPDLLNAVMSNSQIKTAYESNADTNCFTNALKAIVDATSGSNSGDETAARLAAIDHAATAKSALVDSDEVVGMDSANSFSRIRSTWTNIKAFLKTYFDTLYQASSNKDATGGYAGLTLFKINFKNAANTFTNFLTNATTAARTYTFPDKDIAVAGIVDVDAKVEDAIVDGVTTKAPSQNVVFDQLAAKAPLTSPSLTTPNIGAATGTSLTTTGDQTTTGGKFGYATGAGGTVTQATSKATGVTLDKQCGAITMNGAALAAAAEVSFTLTNNKIGADDVVVVCIKSGATTNTYTVQVDQVAAGSCRICVGNYSVTSRSEAIVISFAVVKAVVA